MDETVKPLRIPPEMSVYAEKHEIFDLVQAMVSSLIVDKPEDPVSYLMGLLKRDRVEVPRILLLGPPAAGKTSVARRLCEQLRAIHVTANSLLGDRADVTKPHPQQEVPVEQWTKLITQRLNKRDCFRRGWVLEGFPQTRQQVLSLQQAGVTPDHVVVLEAPDDVLLERSQGRMVDPVTGDVYHQMFIWPSDQTVAQRLERGRSLSEEQRLADLQLYRREVAALRSSYQHQLKTVNTDQPYTDVYQQVLSFALSHQRSLAPHTPRILLFGPPGSGKSLQAKLLAQKYNLVNLCCGDVLKSASVDDSSLGELIKPFIHTGNRAPDSTVLQVLVDRLSRLDCSTQGWVLHGFPRDLEQAQRLHQYNYTPTRVFFLEVTDDVVMERITLRATDPVTGESYHSLYRPAPNPEVQARLRTNPRDSEERVRQKLRKYWVNTASLQSLYPDGVHINADQDPHTVFESLDSRLVSRLPRDLGTATEMEG